MKTANTRKKLMILILASIGLFTIIRINEFMDRIRSPANELNHSNKSGVSSGGEKTSAGSIDGMRQKVAAADNRSPAAVPRRVILKLDQATRIGKADITYRGLVSGSKFRIDVVIPEFYPQVFYPYRLYVGETKKGFRLARRKYRLISAHEAYMHLYLLE